MYEVHDDLYVGNERSCAQAEGEDLAVVHACKHPCHQRAVGYRGSLPNTHEHYLVYRINGDLYLNMVDMDRPQQHKFMKPMVEETFALVDDHIGDRGVLIHCNEGRSRAPTLAMLYLAKRAGVIPNDDFPTARRAFEERYPGYAPATGFTGYLPQYWHVLD